MKTCPRSLCEKGIFNIKMNNQDIPWFWDLSIYTNWTFFACILLSVLFLIWKLKFRIDLAAKLTISLFLIAAAINVSQHYIIE
jgi:hypothetical protein